MDNSQDPQDSTTQSHSQLRRSLEQSRVFGDLGVELIDDLVKTMEVSVIPGGQQLFGQGDASDSLLVVISGRILASRKLDGKTQRLAEIGPGSSVGEVGLVLQQPRAADVVAIRDTSVASLTREQFEQVLKRHPVEFNRAITRTLYSFTTQAQSRPPTIGATAIAVVSLDRRIDTTELCLGIAKSLGKYGKTYHFTPQEGEAFHTGTGASAESNDHLNHLEQCFDYLLYEASSETTPWSHLAVRQADQLILVAGFDSGPTVVTSQNADLLSGPGFDMVRKSLVLLHPAKTKSPKVDLSWRKTFELDRIYPVRNANKEDVQRLVRFMTDRAIGLVLGGGGARGMAHIGVLKALHEKGVPIDMVCGNSMGALIGAQYASGTEVDKLLQTTTAFVRGGEHPALPLVSLLSGNRVRRDLHRMFGEIPIENLWQPFFAVSCNLSRANIKVHDQGPLWLAVLASNSPAGIVPPVVSDGDLLVDAALLDNVPVKAMREKLGFGTLIAVDVDVAEELTVDPALEKLTGWQVLRQRLFGKNEARLPGIIDVLNRSGHLGGLAHRESSKALADHYLQPPVSKFALMGYSKGQAIADTGYEYAIDEIQDWPESLFINSKKL